MKRSSSLQAWLFMMPAAIVILPILWIIVSQGSVLIAHRENLTEPGSESIWAGWSNITRSLSDPALLKAVVVTLVFVVITTGVQLVLGLIIAVLMSDRIKGKGVIRGFLLAPMVLTPVVAGLMWGLLLDPSFGIINYLLSLVGIPSQPFLTNPTWAIIAVIFVEIWQFTPYVITICLAGLESLDHSVLEAATLDGANRGQLARLVQVPMIAPAIGIVVLLRAIDGFKAFALMDAMTQGGPGTATTTIGVYVARMAFERFDVGYATTVGFITSIAVVIVVWPAARRLIQIKPSTTQG